MELALDIHSVTGGEQSASLAVLEDLFDSYHRQALGLACHILGDYKDAEHLVEDAFLTVWRARDSYDQTRGSMRIWLLTIIRNRALDRLRARRHTSPAAQALSVSDVEFVDSGDVSVEADHTIDRAGVLAVLSELPQGQREALELAYFSGMSQTELALELGIPVGTVKTRIQLAITRLARRFSQATPCSDVPIGTEQTAARSSSVPAASSVVSDGSLKWR